MIKIDTRNNYIVLAEDYGYNRGKFMYYYDGLGCNFFIECVKTESYLITAYLGGRVIYRNFNNPLNLATKDLNLPNFIYELWAREYNKFANEPVVENFTILEMYKKKANSNKKNLERYFCMAKTVAKEFGIVQKKKYKGTALLTQFKYEFVFLGDGNELKIHYSETYSGEYAEILHNGRSVFCCRFGSDENIIADFIGEFTEGDVWDEIVFGLYMSAIEEDDRQT